MCCQGLINLSIVCQCDQIRASLGPPLHCAQVHLHRHSDTLTSMKRAMASSDGVVVQRRFESVLIGQFRTRKTHNRSTINHSVATTKAFLEIFRGSHTCVQIERDRERHSSSHEARDHIDARAEPRGCQRPTHSNLPT